MSGSPLADTLRRKGLLTRETYLNLEYMGKPPKQLHPEAEEQLPPELQGPDDPIGGVHPVNAFLSDHPLADLYRIRVEKKYRRKKGR